MAKLLECSPRAAVRGEVRLSDTHTLLFSLAFHQHKNHLVIVSGESDWLRTAAIHMSHGVNTNDLVSINN